MAKSIQTCWAALVMLTGVSIAARGAGPDTPPDLETQYQAAVAQLKHPAITGILVTEVDPESATAGTGLRAGDILTEYAGTRLVTLKQLRALVADTVARHLDDGLTGTRVIARVRRGDVDVLLSMPRDALGIRAVAVEANVPGPRNPPPDKPGDLVLNWPAVLQALSDDNAAGHGGIAPAAFRMFEGAPVEVPAADSGHAAPIEESWIGWQLSTATQDGDALAGTLEIHRLSLSSEKQAGPIANELSQFGFRLRHLGDAKTPPPFELFSVSSMFLGENDLYVNATADRLGEGLKVGIRFSTQPTPPPGALFNEQQTVASPLDAIPQAAVPWLAAALPQQADAAIGLHLLTIRHFAARPGYVLVTRGRQEPPSDPTGPSAGTAPAAARPAPWRVDLMHSGVLVESYWFSDQRRLLVVQSAGTPDILLRRVSSPKEASMPLTRAPDRTAQPATSPTPP